MEISIDGRTVQAAEGQTVLDVALASGIDIPRLCYHPELVPSGACRLCLVEVEGRPAPLAACGLAAAPGLNVSTQSDRLYQLRREVVSLLLSDHPLRCVVCDRAGKCGLQKYAYEFGLAESQHRLEFSRALYQDDNPFFVRDHQACILCGKCVRVCDEVVGANAIEQSGRGFFAHVATPFDGEMADSTCVFCGSCVALCPTSALSNKSRLGRGREWELRSTRTVCGYCGVGCAIQVLTDRNGSIVEVRGIEEGPGIRRSSVNGELLCAKGRYGWDFVSHPDRLTTPLVRRELAESLGLAAPADPKDAFVATDWDTALDLVADRLAATVREHGPDSVAGLASARCTNEENYVFQKMVRVALGTNNVDHCARLCHASTVAGLSRSFGSGAMTNSMREIRDADCILVTGSNTTEAHPVIGYEVNRAVRLGATLIVIDPRRIPLAQKATLFLQPTPGTDWAVFLAMIAEIIREGWLDQAFIAERTEGYEAFAESVLAYTPGLAEQISGVPADLIVQAAKAYALGQRADETESTSRGESTILYAMGITQRSHGTDLVQTLASLALVAGQIGRPSTGVNPLRGQANVQGACDVGALPDLLPGYQRVADEAARTRIAASWGVDSIPERPGLTVVEMMQAAARGYVKAMYIMGENPLVSDPDIAHVRVALERLDFLVVQDAFLSETAALADVVLPAAVSLEKSGTLTNTERRVQSLHPAVDAPGEARPDLDITAALARRLDERLGAARPASYWDYPTPAAALRELAAVAPIYGGVTPERLEADHYGLQWPCPTVDHPGTPVLHTKAFTRPGGKAFFSAVRYQPAAELPDADYPLILTTGRTLYHYHTGTLTRRSAALDWREPRAYAELSRRDAESAGIRDGGQVVITSRRGTIRCQARVDDRVPPGVVFVPMHFAEAAANALTNAESLDPVAKIPEYKVCAVRIASPARPKAATPS